jgi:hypothetical protein
MMFHRFCFLTACVLYFFTVKAIQEVRLLAACVESECPLGFIHHRCFCLYKYKGFIDSRFTNAPRSTHSAFG